jgi:metal-dependent amidase/aminoacylase/carboxypeptidase family protein
MRNHRGVFMSRHRSLRLTLAASVIAVVAACGGGAPAAPALTDPVDILAQSVQTLNDVKSFRADVAVSGSLNVDVMGTGQASGVQLDNTTAQLDVDVENKNAKATFSAGPALLNISGELIQVGGTSYVKTSLTGPLYQKSESEAGAVDEATNMTEEDIAELREQLAKVQPTKGEDVSCGDKQCYTVTIDLDAAELQSLGGELPTEDLPADMSEASVNATFKIEKDTLRPAAVDLTMDLGSQGSVTVAVTLSNWDEAVSIEAPPAEQVQS